MEEVRVIPVNAEVTWNDKGRWSGGTAWESGTRVHVSGEGGDVTWRSMEEGTDGEERMEYPSEHVPSEGEGVWDRLHRSVT